MPLRQPCGDRPPLTGAGRPLSAAIAGVMEIRSTIDLWVARANSAAAASEEECVDDDIVEVELPNEGIALVRARQLDGAGATKTGVGRLDLDSVSTTLEGVAQAVKAGVVKAAPSKVSVELAMEFAVKSGVLTALIVDGESKGSLTVTLEWERETEKKD